MIHVSVELFLIHTISGLRIRLKMLLLILDDTDIPKLHKPYEKIACLSPNKSLQLVVRDLHIKYFRLS